MSLQFVFGNAGSGKSTYLQDQVIAGSMQHPDRNYIVLVPEQFTMQTQKDLVTRHPRRGIMNIDVLSFGRLAHRIFEEVGQEKTEILDDVGKNLILRKVAEDCQDSLHVFKGNLKKIGYITEVKSIISEFIQYNLSMEKLEILLQEIPREDSLYYKLQDLKIVLEHYNQYTGEHYISKEELLEVLCQVVPKSKILKDSVVILDGYTGFTPVQYSLIGELLKVCSCVCVAVTIDKREDKFLLKHPYQLFALSKQTVVNLSQTAKACKVEIEDPVELYPEPACRFRENAPLAFLEQELFRYSRKTYEKEQNQIEVHRARNGVGEVRFVAEEIRRLTRKQGYHYSEIAVITADMSTYGDYVETEFAGYEIPVFMDQKRSVLLNPFVEYLRSMLCMIEQNYSYESVFRYLRTGLAGFCNYEVDYLENYVIALGCKGFKKWQEPWIRKTRTMSEADLKILNCLRVRFVDSMVEVHHILKQPQKTVQDITRALYDMLVQEKIQKKLNIQKNTFQRAGELALAKEYDQIYGIVLELFDKFVELLGNERLSLKEYSILLDAGFEEAKVGVIPPSMDQVVVGDMERTRLKDIKALFFIGAVDSVLPGNLAKGGLLSERDRSLVKQNHFALSPDGKEKSYIQKFYLYLNLTKPTKKLYLTYSKVSGDGKSQRPAYLISDVMRLFPNINVIDEEMVSPAAQEYTEKTGIKKVIEGLRNLEGFQRQACYRQLYSWYFHAPDWNQKVKTLVEAGFYHKPEDELSKEVAEQLYGKEFRGSISRLENFGVCAFAHYLRYGLLLSERELYEFQPVDMGNVFHRSMEKYAVEMKRRGNDWGQITQEEQASLSDRFLEESIADYGNGVLYQTTRDHFAIHRMKRMMHRTVWALTEQLKRGDFAPEAIEYSFGRGKIDRIDTVENDKRVYVKIVDYKTGSKSFDIVSLYYGLQMQLVVYMNEAVEIEKERHPEKEVVPAGIFYYQVQDPVIKRGVTGVEGETRGDGQYEQQVEEQMLKELKPDGLIRKDEHVISHLDRNFEKKSLVIPVGKTQKGYDAYSKVLEPEEFQNILDYSKHMEKVQNEKILEGEIGIAPYQKEQSSGCDFCEYRSVCKFDSRISGYEYRKIPSMKRDEVIEKIKQELRGEEA